MRRPRALACLVLLAAACRQPAAEPSREYHVSPTGDDGGSCERARQPGTARRTLRAALACVRPGDTLTLHSGRFEERVATWPSGAPGRPITIRAASEGSVILSAGLQLQPGNAHLLFQGLRFHGGAKAVIGQHLRFYRNEWRGSCPATNCATAIIGSIESGATHDVLLEDNWFHGRGGRANIAMFNASGVVIRRAVVRHDGGWAADTDEELIEAAVIVHNSQDVLLADVLVLDSDLPYHNWRGAIVIQRDGSSATPVRSVRLQGVVALDAPVAGLQVLGSGVIQDLSVERSLFSGPDGGILLGHGSTDGIRLSDLRVLGSRARGSSRGNGPGIGFFGTGQVAVERTEVSGFAAALSGVEAPKDRAPREPPLAGSSSWPWPQQARIHRELCIEAGVSRGFCRSRCLSAHVLAYLGRAEQGTCEGVEAVTPAAAPAAVGAPTDAAAPDRVPEFGDGDLVDLACPPPACLVSGDDGTGPPMEEFGSQWGAFTLEGDLRAPAGADAWLALADERPMPGETLPVRVQVPAGRLRLAVDVPAARYTLTVIHDRGRGRPLAASVPFATAAERLRLLVLGGRAGAVTWCRTSLTRAACFRSNGGSIARFAIDDQAGPVVARAGVTRPSSGAWVALGGRHVLGHALPGPITRVRLADQPSGQPVRLTADASRPTPEWASFSAGAGGILIDRWEAGGADGLEICPRPLQVPRCLQARAIRRARPRHRSFCPQRSPFTASAELVPAAGRLDAGLGLASGSVSEWNSLGPIVRFSPAGVIDANDGGQYRPSRLNWHGGQRYRVRLVVDPIRRRYDAFVTPLGGGEQELGRDLRFRNQELDRFDTFVMPIETGHLMACDFAVGR